ncbi:MAG: hypothetical protein JXB49_35420, partial [Bacteroidales bacterium]|nr:hypothetical protein [Bacteroidales bacterium]
MNQYCSITKNALNGHQQKHRATPYEKCIRIPSPERAQAYALSGLETIHSNYAGLCPIAVRLKCIKFRYIMICAINLCELLI